MSQIYISIGSNIDREAAVRAALKDLQREFGPLHISSCYESESVGFKGDLFYNLVVGAQTSRDVDDVVATLKQLEKDNGRTPCAQKFSSRRIDLDLLLYDELKCELPCELPRGEITYNAFVLWPLAEIAPDLVHPGTGLNYARMWAEFDKDRQRLYPVEFDTGVSSVSFPTPSNNSNKRSDV